MKPNFIQRMCMKKYKHDHDSTLTRLRIILQKLNEGEALSVSDLAQEFNVSSRTIQRDFNEKLVASYPIEKVGRKWKMQDGFRIEKTSDIEEMLVLDILENFAENMGSKFSSKAKKLLNKLKNEDYNPIYTKLDLEDISDKLEDIQALEIAIKSKKVITCSYEIKNKFKTTLKPLKIVNFEGFWYLLALDKKDILKKYYLKNIYDITLTDNLFTVNKDIKQTLDNSITIWFNTNNKPYDVKLYLSPKISKYFKRKPISKTQTIESLNSDGSMVINLKVTDDMEVLNFLTEN